MFVISLKSQMGECASTARSMNTGGFQAHARCSVNKSMNTRGFQTAVKCYEYPFLKIFLNPLPSQTHITYDGCFNQLKYSIGPKAKKRMELHIGFARAQNPQSSFDNGINNYLTVFTKGSKDGEDRDDRILNAVIVLDVSYSMGWPLTSQGTGKRLQLAKEAILMFFSRLRKNDAFGLVVFSSSAKTLIPLQAVSKIQIEAITQILKEIRLESGTTLMTGFQQSLRQMKSYLSTNPHAKQSQCQNRFVILTDVEDNSVTNSKKFVEQIQASQVHTTIIGISDAFKSEVCEQLSQVKGFNYFCATQLGDLKKYLFQNFSFTFFPDTYDIQISVTSKNIKSIQVFGTNDSAKVPLYNVKCAGNFIITKSKTSFPSELQIGADGTVKTYGGLMLIKLNLKDKEKASFEGQVHLKYRTAEGQKFEQDYHFKYETPLKQQFYSDQSLYEALSGFFYVYEIKNVLKAIKQEGDKPSVRKKFVEPLKKMRNLVPNSKHQSLDCFISLLEQPNNHEQYQIPLKIERFK